MGIFSLGRRRTYLELTTRSKPTPDSIFREQIDFIVDALGHFGVPSQDADDVAQEVLRAVLRALPTFDPSAGDLRSWLYGIVRIQALTYHRHMARLRAREELREELSDIEPGLSLASISTPEEHMIQGIDRQMVREVLLTIEAERRAVLVAIEVYGITAIAMANVMDLPLGTVKSRLRLARDDFQKEWSRRQRVQSRAGAVVLPLRADVLLACGSMIPRLPELRRAALWGWFQQIMSSEKETGSRSAEPEPHPDPEVGRLGSAAASTSLLGPGNATSLLVGAGLGVALVLLIEPPGGRPAPPAVITPEALAAACAISTAAPRTSGSVATREPVAVSPLAVRVPPVRSAPTSAATSASPARSVSSADAASATPDDDELAAELALLRVAQVAFDRGDLAAAEMNLAQHEQRFARGKMASSRELLRVRLLLREGKRGEATARAEGIRRGLQPDSPLARTLDGLLNMEPSR